MNQRWGRFQSRGFTLIEMMVTAAILTVITALAGMGLMYGMGRARLKSSVFTITAMSSVAQIRASSLGRPNYLVVYQEGTSKKFGVMHVELNYPEPTLAEWQAVNIITLNSAAPVVAGRALKQFDKVDLSGTGSIALGRLATTFNPMSNYIKLPFAAPASVPTGADLLGACNFCVSAVAGSIGVLLFNPDGTLTPVTEPTASTCVLGIEALRTGEASNPKLIAFSVPSGLTRIFHKNP